MRSRANPVGLALPADDAAKPAAEPEAAVALSVVIPVNREEPDLAATHHAYLAAIQRIGGSYELIYVLDGHYPNTLATLRALKESDPLLIVLVLGGEIGEAAALAAGFAHARGETILTLPAHLQVDADDIPRVVGALDHCQMAIGRRSAVNSGLGQRLLAGMFHRVLRLLFGHSLSDLVCRVRACRRGVLDEIGVYGFQHHFVPLLAQQQGFAVHEVDVRPGPASVAVRRTPLVYLGILFDILTLYVLLRFTKKPLRFFGSIGLLVLIPGLLFTAALAIARLFYAVPLADRPALILGVLMIVLGIQIIALGLIGEIVIFASGRRIKDYTIDKVL
ncbi:MAG TPA: glycosyltransferase [Geminicoccaceae bacterium]|nr:glycosyltransferase [Geminicoccaceae bacterium]